MIPAETSPGREALGIQQQSIAGPVGRSPLSGSASSPLCCLAMNMRSAEVEIAPSDATSPMTAALVSSMGMHVEATTDSVKERAIAAEARLPARMRVRRLIMDPEVRMRFAVHSSSDGVRAAALVGGVPNVVPTLATSWQQGP